MDLEQRHLVQHGIHDGAEIRKLLQDLRTPFVSTTSKTQQETQEYLVIIRLILQAECSVQRKDLVLVAFLQQPSNVVLLSHDVTHTCTALASQQQHIRGRCSRWGAWP